MHPESRAGNGFSSRSPELLQSVLIATRFLLPDSSKPVRTRNARKGLPTPQPLTLLTTSHCRCEPQGAHTCRFRAPRQILRIRSLGDETDLNKGKPIEPTLKTGGKNIFLPAWRVLVKARPVTKKKIIECGQDLYEKAAMRRLTVFFFSAYAGNAACDDTFALR